MSINANSLNKLVGDALAIEAEDAKTAGALGFMARALVQATMPHKNPGDDVAAWGRENGFFSMVMQPGYIMQERNPKSIGLPYGSIPRLLLAWLTTEAVKKKERELILGDTLSQFMEQLGLVPTGGRWGSITRLKEQMKRLFSATISCVYDDQESRNDRVGYNIAKEHHLWWDPKRPEQAALWQSTVTLSQDFFNEIIDRPVPIDMRALKALKSSPMALDIYSWLTYRMSYLESQRPIPWQALLIQFGSDYQRVRDFKRKFLLQLKKVMVIYDGLNISYDTHNLILKPSKTHIAKR